MQTGTSVSLTDVWGTSGNDVFFVGIAGKIFHYDGISFNEMNSNSDVDLFSIWGSAQGLV